MRLRIYKRRVWLKSAHGANFAVIEATDDSAKIVDDLVNNSFLVDAVTKERRKAEGSGERLQDTFELERVDGNWVVVRSTRIRWKIDMRRSLA